MRPFSRTSLGGLTAVTMTVATFPVMVFSVLAAQLIAEFDIHRWQVGALVTAAGITGALLSPVCGRLTDRVGAVRSTFGVLAVGLGGLALVAASPTYFVLFLAAIVTGIPQGWSNPATNALIVDNIPSGSRGVVTGVKQSGVQMGTFLGGLVLPPLAAIWDWRYAVAAFMLLPVAALAGMWGRPESRSHSGSDGQRAGQIPPVVKWIAAYGAISGLASSAIFTFLPLFAEEDQMWTASQGGWLLASVGLTGIIARIAWGSASESWLGHGRTLRLLALQSSLAGTLLALAARGTVPGWTLAPAAFLFASGAIAWNAVGMLAVMDYSPQALVGRGTGLVLLGFLLGVGLGAPLMGLSVDRLGVYWPGWLAVTVLFLMAALVAGRIHRSGTIIHL